MHICMYICWLYAQLQLIVYRKKESHESWKCLGIKAMGIVNCEVTIGIEYIDIKQYNVSQTMEWTINFF